ncbi:MAG: UvrABC system protein A [Deltaproteobacteria bacterium]|jgi:excinuclease ABC subunit A|nr:MAG: UvrABC system protein A [Deltaproteobacteria bacterium]
MQGEIRVLGARENNLKNINITIPWYRYTVITGLSGSGKSSLAIDTIYTEALRRFVECLSTYARQFLERVDRPDVDDITGLPPVIAIESRNHVKNSRSTVGTTTEVYDYLRLLFAKIGRIFCPDCNIEVRPSSPENIAEEVVKNYRGNRIFITFPLKVPKAPEELLSKGFTRVWNKGKLIEIEELTFLPQGFEVLVDRVVAGDESKYRITDSLEQAFNQNTLINIHTETGKTLRYSKELVCPYCNREFYKPFPLLFSFNSPQGACKECRGFGNILRVDPDLVVPNPDKTLAQGAIEPFTKPSFRYEMKRLLQFAKKKGIDINTPYRNLPEEAKELLFEGDGDFPGINGYFKYLEEKNYKLHVRVFLSKYRSAFTCKTCKGSRLKAEALWVKIGGRNIWELTELSIKELKAFFEKLKLTEYEENIAKEILRQINSRIDFLLKVGLDYLTLSRLTRTLSGGEAQRVNLACQLGGSLTDTLYIMDEPSVGLHPRDISRLISIIKELRDRNNTIVVVEHDFDMIRSADYIIELGPFAGEKGGEVVYQGPQNGFLNNGCPSLTRNYMTQKEIIPLPPKRRKGNGKTLTVVGASENNLKNITVTFPLGTLICITGVSGSGKSSLIYNVLYSNLARKFNKELEKPGKVKDIVGTFNISDIVMLDQNPIGKSSKSNPVTYVKAYDDIRKIMAHTRDAQLKGFLPSHFSFNTPGGRCEACEGEGKQKIEMHFLADIYITCDECQGKRFKKEILEVKYKGKNIDDILNLTVEESILFFAEFPALIRKLNILKEVGLGYLRLGQPAPTLSGGEAQRIKIARELGRKDGKDILYILDEPTVGLHIEDVKKLLSVLNKLVDAGNTVIVIEHNLDVIKSADYIIDLGPEGGEKGGYVVAQGTPEEVAKSKDSYTAKYLRQLLN